MNKTKIEYLDYTWNPIAMRCTPISTGCKHCWHLKMAKRLANNPKIPYALQRAYSGEVVPTGVLSRFDDPLKLKKPSRIGVQFMGDLFHEDVPFRIICNVFGVMGRARWHTFLVLTKRPERMIEWARWQQHETGEGYLNEGNVWLGVSVENQQAADERIPELLQIPAAVHFVSVEPMLEPIDFRYWTWDGMDRDNHPKYKRYEYPTAAISWIVAAAESGPGARPMDEDWVRDLRNQCVNAGIPLFYKQRIENGKKVSMPELDGRVWDQFPEGGR